MVPMTRTHFTAVVAGLMMVPLLSFTPEASAQTGLTSAAVGDRRPDAHEGEGASRTTRPLLPDAVAQSDARPTATVPVALSRASMIEMRRLVQNEGKGMWPAQTRSLVTSRTRLAKCSSKKKGLLIGAALGAVAGGTFAAILDSTVFGVGPEVVPKFAAGGAGVGSLVGFFYCS